MSDTAPTRLPLIATPENRGVEPDLDARVINGYAEKSAMGDLWCRKRPAYVLYASVAGAGKVAGGLHAWNDNVYSVFGDGFYAHTTSLGAVDDSDPAGYTFSSTLATTPQLFFHNNTAAYVYDSGGGLVAVADADYPAATVHGSVYLDGTMYVMTPTCHIQGSAINDPTSWDPLNSIRAQIEPGTGVAIAKQMSYLIAFKEHTTEVFYNAQNIAGSPLGRVEGAQFHYGCYVGSSIADIGGALFYLGHTQAGTVNVIKLERLKHEIISTPAIERILQGNFRTTSIRATGLYSGGHSFYALTRTGVGGLTLVYDIGEKLWYQWTDTNGDHFPLVSAAKQSIYTPVCQGLLDGKLHRVQSEIFADDDGPFTVDLYTPNWDAGSRRRKVVNMLEINADQQSAGILQVRTSDDDYRTWSNFRSIDLASEKPMLDQMGTFLKRAHHFRHRGPEPLRLRAVDLHADLGIL